MPVSWMPSTAPKVEMSASDRGALALIKQTLADYGLPDTLARWAWDQIVEGRSEAEVMLELRQRPEFKNEYGDVIDGRAKAGLAPMTPAEIIAFRNQAAQLMHAAGLPQDFYDSKDDFTRFMVNNWSLAELNDHIQVARDATYNIPPAAQARLEQRFGLVPGSGHLTAFALDPDRALPLIIRDFEAAKIGGRADMAGYAGVSNETAATLADAGVTEDQAARGFSELARSSELFKSMDAGEEAIGQDEQLGAAFLNNARAQQRIEQRRRKRQSAFQGGGGFADGAGGVRGLASA